MSLDESFFISVGENITLEEVVVEENIENSNKAIVEEQNSSKRPVFQANIASNYAYISFILIF